MSLLGALSGATPGRALRALALFPQHHPVVESLLRRVAALVLIMFSITVIAFILTTLVPIDPVAANLGESQLADPAIVRAFKEKYGLDKPLPVRYVLYLEHLAKGDLGLSVVTGRPVRTDLESYIPASAELGVMATLMVIVAGILFGTLAAVRRNSVLDQMIRVLSLVGTSVPTFWLGLVALYVFFLFLGWFPSAGRLDAGVENPPQVTGLFTVDALLSGEFDVFVNALHHMVLPASVLAAYGAGTLIRFTRAAVLDVAGEDYITVARAKGLSPLGISRHLMRAALPQVITVIGYLFAEVLTGTVLVETIFAWPGIGRYAFHAALNLDLPAIMGVLLFIALVFVSVNFVVDVLYPIIDPRLRSR